MTRRRKRRRKHKREKRPQKRVSSRSAGRERVYPNPAERERIIQRRDDLLKELIEVFVTQPPAEHTAAVNRLIREYGASEVQVVLNSLDKGRQRPFIAETSFLYRDYRLAFARFGGERRFLSKREYEELNYEHASLAAKREFKSLFRRGPGKRERELHHLVLADERMWDDIVPPAPPPRPPDFAAPPVGSYPEPLPELLALGWKADDEGKVTAMARKAASKWKPFIPDLERAVLDEGLLSGWPADPPAWAPLHALRLLGHLRAYPSAGRLLALMDREDDWLSDLLPSVWAEMGPQAAEPLWTYITDYRRNPEHRGNVMLGLCKLAEKYPQYRPEIIRGLIQLLDASPVEDREANAYIAHVLSKLGAHEALPALGRAYDAGKVDHTITAWYDVTGKLGEL